MKKLTAGICAVALALGGSATLDIFVPAPVKAQSNDNDYTPLNSRIRRNRQFPTSLMNPYRGEIGSATRERSREMMGRFTRCIYDRSNKNALEFLATTDFGIQSFQQLDLENERASRIYGFQDCLRRVANSFGTGVQLSWTAFGLRRWFVEQAYLDRYPEGPDWLQPGYVIDERSFPLSANNGSVSVAMNLADCIVASDPFTSDFLFRTESGSEQEAQAIQTLVPLIQPCLPEGQRIEINPDTLRAWIGEGLWHASSNSSPPPPEGEDAEETAQERVQAAMAPSNASDPLSDPGQLAELQRIAMCALENSRNEAVAMLQSGTVNNPDDGQFDAIMQANLGCLEGPTNIPRMVLAGFMAEKLYSDSGITFVAAMPEDFDVTSLPLCVALRGENAPSAMDAIIAQAPGGSEESAAVEALREAWESCAPGAPFQPAMVRGAMTVGLFSVVWEKL